MNARSAWLIALICGSVTSFAAAEPRFVAIPGFLSGVSNGGSVVVGANGENTFRWTLSGNSGAFTLLSGGFGGSPSCSADGTIVVSDVENGQAASNVNGFAPENRLTGRWSSATGFVSLGLFTTPFPVPGVGTPIPPGFINTPSGISEDGNVVVGLAYVLGGDPLSAFRPFRADVAAGTLISLGQLGGQGARATCVSGNGLVTGGWDRSPTSSVNRPAIWRFDPANGSVSEYVFDTVADDFGEIGACNVDGTLAAGSSTAFPDQLVLWSWNGTTYVPSSLGTMNGNVQVTGMSRDGSMIVGSSGSFFFGQNAFIWTAATGMVDLTTYLQERGATGLPAGDVFGASLAISPDGTAITVGGFGAPSGVVFLTGGPACVGISEVDAPNLTEISACEPTAILNVSVTGTGPFTYQWRRNLVDLVDGDTGTGSSLSGATGRQLFVSGASLADTGAYDCVISNPCGSIFSSVRQVTALPPGPYDTCATAREASGEGAVELEMCGAYINESPASCVQGPQAADVWIRFTPQVSGDYRISTCDQPGYDTILTTYDQCGGPETACSGDFCFSLASIDRITLTAGHPILVRLGVGFVAPPAPVRVTFSLVGPAPANDLCDAATELSGPGEYAFDSTNAGRDGDSSCGFQTGRDVWFRYVPPARGTVTLSTCGSSFDTALAAFAGCGGAERGCNNDAFTDGCTFQSLISDLPVSAGQPLLIRVAGSDQNTGGTGTLTLAFTAATGCISDFNGDGDINADDLGDYITCYFTEPPCAAVDFNTDGNIDADDLGDFITVYFAGCP